MSPDSTVDALIKLSVLNKLSRHLWYLGENLIDLAFFDSNTSIDVKRKMVYALNNVQSQNENLKSLWLNEIEMIRFPEQAL